MQLKGFFSKMFKKISNSVATSAGKKGFSGINNSDILKNIEAIAGLPTVCSHKAILNISDYLMPLLSKVNDELKVSKAHWDVFDDLTKLNQKREFIKAAGHLFPEETLRLSNLVTVQPPNNVHRMQRSDPYWVGDFFSANMIIHALDHCDLNQSDLSILDIGCSSGSLMRVLAAYDHSWKIQGCDPIDSAIEWGSGNVTTCSFQKMSISPPLPYDAGAMDGCTAISVWSHHSPEAAQIWIDEVARVLKPGGFFAVTFSTLHHIRWLAKNDRMSPEKLMSMLKAFAQDGNYFVPIDYDGEENETDSTWGQSAYSRERFFSMFFAKFDVAGYFPGLNQGNQDLAVFCKR